MPSPDPPLVPASSSSDTTPSGTASVQRGDTALAGRLDTAGFAVGLGDGTDMRLLVWNDASSADITLAVVAGERIVAVDVWPDDEGDIDPVTDVMAMPGSRSRPAMWWVERKLTDGTDSVFEWRPIAWIDGELIDVRPRCGAYGDRHRLQTGFRLPLDREADICIASLRARPGASQNGVSLQEIATEDDACGMMELPIFEGRRVRVNRVVLQWLDEPGRFARRVTGTTSVRFELADCTSDE